ncbi:hypothetical protein V8E36_003705 [Tilletia maclaganii]
MQLSILESFISRRGVLLVVLCAVPSATSVAHQCIYLSRLHSSQSWPYCMTLLHETSETGLDSVLECVSCAQISAMSRASITCPGVWAVWTSSSSTLALPCSSSPAFLSASQPPRSLAHGLRDGRDRLRRRPYQNI